MTFPILRKLTEGIMKDAHLDAQETLMHVFSLEDSEAETVLDFVINDGAWEDIPQQARERLYSHYQKSMDYGTAKAKTGDPYIFIAQALKKDLGL